MAAAAAAGGGRGEGGGLGLCRSCAVAVNRAAHPRRRGGGGRMAPPAAVAWRRPLLAREGASGREGGRAGERERKTERLPCLFFQVSLQNNPSEPFLVTMTLKVTEGFLFASEPCMSFAV